MMTPKQKWTIAGLVPVCLAVWVPQLLNSGTTSGQVSLDGPAESEIMPGETMPGVSGAGAPHQSGGQGPAPSPGGGSQPSGPGDKAGGDAGTDRSRGMLVADVLKTLGASEAFRVPGSRSDAVVQGIANGETGEEEGAGEFSSSAQLVSPMVSFVEDHPLRGTMAGETTRFAVFGSHRVREGELLPGTGAVVAEIRRTGVRIEEAGMTLEVSLPPLQTRPRSASTQETGQGSPQGASPGGTDAPSTSNSIGPVSVPEAIPSGQ